MKPIEGDDQIEFAAPYVVDRITEAIEMTRMSLDNLNRISAKSLPKSTPGHELPSLSVCKTVSFALRRIRRSNCAVFYPNYARLCPNGPSEFGRKSASHDQ